MPSAPVAPKRPKILADWETYLPKFWQVVPPSEADTPLANPDAVAEDKVLSSVHPLGSTDPGGVSLQAVQD
jgi:hypothetical protein